MSAALPIRRRAAVFWRRLGPTNTRHTLMLCAMFGGLIALSVYRISQPAAVPPVQPVRTIAMDPLGEFAKTRIGQVLYSSTVGDNCRRVIFDNRTGSLYEAGHVFCGQETPADGQPTGANRITSMRDSFMK